ncbi:MAG: ABC transporter permease [Desulfopila sp.]
MFNILKIACRNLFRYKRRTILTSTLVTLGVVAVLLFIAAAGSFKNMMIGQVTDSMLGHIQVHRKGYLAAIDSLPLNLNMNENQVLKIREILEKNPEVEAFSPRIKIGAMFSNYAETTNIRLNAVIPEMEFRTVPLLRDRIAGGKSKTLLQKGGILVPELLAKGMKVQVGDDIVLVATNKDGSVNGQSFRVGGVVVGISGPGGRDGYIHLDDAHSLLRMETKEASEIAIRLKNMNRLHTAFTALSSELESVRNKMDKPVFEVHTWTRLTPFYNIVKMIDLMTLFIKIMLVAIVLVSIMNVMVMSVYERIREIGTIAAMGTSPNKILLLFLTEGTLLGLLGATLGVIVSLIAITALRAAQISFDFGQQKGLILNPTLGVADMAAISAIVICIAAIGSLQPAWKAAKMDPITALRHT